MRICVFLSSYEGSGSALEAVDEIPCNPEACTDRHTFEYRFIHKANAKQEIDAAAAEGFEFYFNFFWGSLDDPVAGIRESQYFESLSLPSCGIRSWERLSTKNDFFNKARLRGSPAVPGTDRFPLFVKPANGCSSLLIDQRSLCHNEEELIGALRRIHEGLREPRVRRTEAMGIQDKEGYANSYSPAGRDSDDNVVQDLVDGQDCTCSVVKMSLPGGHRSVIDIFIMNQLLSCSDMKSMSDKVAKAYDDMAPHYDKYAEEEGNKFVGINSPTCVRTERERGPRQK